ncbi:MAG: hypothetical protein KDD51_08585 [Bdellovibrionales bacterium]|nr:hypothetical protein [Bdellovibrionales bacterium]
MTREAYEEASSSLSDSNRWLGEVQKEQRNLANQLANLENQLTTQRSQKTVYENENTLLSDRADKIRDALEKQQGDLEKLADRVEKAERAQKRAEAEVNQTSGQITQVGQDIASAQQTVQEKRQAVRRAEQGVTTAEKALADAQAATAQLDAEKEELDGKISVLMPEVQRLQQDLERLSKQIENVEEELKTAEGEKKDQLEKRLAKLKSSEQESQKDLGEKRQDLQQTRRRLVAIPAEKAAKKREEAAAERALATAKEGVTTANADLTVAQEAVESLRKTERELNRDLAAANQALKTANANLREIQQHSEALKGRIKELRDEQRDNLARQRELAKAIRDLTQTINTLENDSIPSVERAQTKNDADVVRFTNDVEKYTRQKSEKERLVSRLQVQLQNVTDILARELRARDTISAELKGYTDRQGEASAESAAILDANKVRERNIAQIEREQVQPAKQRVKEISDSNKELRTARDTKQKEIDQAIEIELFAKAAYGTAQQTADTLQGEWNTASNELAAVKARYTLGKDRAIADGSAAGKAAGVREAGERAGAAGGGVGTTEGAFDGALDGGRGLKQKIYDEALEKAYRAAYDSTKIEKALETLADKEARLNQSELQARFLSGQATGKDVGYRDGLKEGDNATQEAAGRAQGTTDGKAEAERLAEQTHKPLGKKAREDEILSSPPKQQIEKDLLEDSPTVGLNEVPSLGNRLAAWGQQLWDSLVPSVRADKGKGVLKPEQVPAPTYQYPAGATSYEHPDYDEEYADAYRLAYAKFYTSEYIDAYKRVFDSAYDTAYGVAYKDAADPEKHDYPEVKEKGVAKGTLLGRFEGLGYNAAYAEYKAKGVSEGEAKAYARGYNAAKEPAKIAHLPTAQKNAVEAGRAEVESFYRNNAVVKLVAGEGSAKLIEGDADGKFSFGEKVSLNVRVRNFGGVDAEEGDLKVKIDPRSVSGITLEDAEIDLTGVEKDTEVNFKNVLTGKIGAGANVAFSGSVVQNGKVVGNFEVKEEVYSPFTIKFTYEYDLAKGLVVPTTDGHTGAYNFVWIHSDSEKALGDLDSVQITPTDRTLVAVSQDSTGFLKLGSPIQKIWRRPNHFALYGFRRQGLEDNKMRVILKNKSGEVVFDREIAAPVTVVR